MRTPASESRVTWVVMAAMLAASVVGVLAVAGYVAEERRWADMAATDYAIGMLSEVPTTYTGPMAREEHALAMHDAEYYVGLFLHSDSLGRLGSLGSHLERCWTAHLAAEQLWTLSEDGEDRPLVEDVYGAAGLLDMFPRLSALTVGEGPSRRYLDDDLEVVRVLLEEGLREMESVMRAWGGVLHEPGQVY